MTNAYELRNHFFLEDYNTAITREDFEIGGWDGKSYDGESRRATVYRTTVKGYEDVRLIKVGKGLHYIEEDTEVLEKATGEYHKRASWLVDVRRK